MTNQRTKRTYWILGGLAPAIMMLTTVGCGDGLTDGTEQVRSAVSTSQPTYMTVPAYFGATDTGDWDRITSNWDRVTGVAGNIAILNGDYVDPDHPNYPMYGTGGPPSSNDANMAHLVADLHRRGVVLLGYVQNWPGRKSSKVLNNIDTWMNGYLVDGIFFDESPRDGTDSLDLSTQLGYGQYVHRNFVSLPFGNGGQGGQPSMIMFNWGSNPSNMETYVNCMTAASQRTISYTAAYPFTRFITEETDYDTYILPSTDAAFPNTPQDTNWVFSYPAVQFAQISYLGTGEQESQLTADNVTNAFNKAVARNAAAFYVTDNTTGDVWGTPVASQPVWNTLSSLTSGTAYAFNSPSTPKAEQPGCAPPIFPYPTKDFNHDAKSDLLWWHSADGVVGSWLLDGTTVIGTTTLNQTAQGTDWVPGGTGDFNGDGIADVLWWHPPDGVLVIWLMSADGATATPVQLPATNPGSNGYQLIGAGDFTGDGSADIIWWNPTTGVVQIWPISNLNFRNGWEHNFTWTATGDSGWVPIAAGDFDYDGGSDLLWWHKPSGAVSVWLTATGGLPGNVKGTINVNWSAAASSGWSLVGVGDFNHDLKTDLVWHHTDGTVNTWLLDGGTVIGNPNFSWSASDASGWSIISR